MTCSENNCSNEELKLTEEEEKIAIITGIKEKLSKVQRLEYEKAYIKKYKPLFEADEFWLQKIKYTPDKTMSGEERIFNEMQQYLKDYSSAYGRLPSWYQYSVYRDDFRTSLAKMNIKSFMEIMKHYWEDNGSDAVGIPAGEM